jgi:hypothetical protein
MSADNLYYQANLKYLFENPGNSQAAVYNVDKILFKYISFDDFGQVRKNVGFETDVVPNTFFKDVGDVVMSAENPTDVATRIIQTDLSALQPLPKTTTFDQTDPLKEDVRIDIVPAASMNPSIITNIQKYLTQASLNNNNPAKYHTNMNEYMKNVITTVCSRRFKDSITKLSTVYSNLIKQNQQNNITKPTNLLDALQVLVGVSSTRMDMIMLAVDNQCAKSLRNILTPIQNPPINIMSDFNVNFVRPLYYLVRTDIVSNLILPQGIIPVLSNEETIYLYKIIADAYIKACYPLLHYGFIDYLLQKYTAVGDFVNTRIALLAKVLFTYAFVDYINTNVAPNDSTDTALTMKGVIDKIITTLNNYLIDLNNIDVSSSAGVNKMSDIIKEVHQMSNVVVDKAQTVEEVKGQISNNQIVLRNLIVNHERAHNTLKWTRRRFWFQFFILLTVVLAGAVLLLINKPVLAFKLAAGFGILMVFIVSILLLGVLIRLFSSN